MPSMGGSATLISAPRYGDLTNVDTTGQADHQIFAWDATAGKYQPLTGVVGDGVGGTVMAGGLALQGNTADPNYPVQLDANAYVAASDGVWHFGSVAVGPGANAAGGTIFNAGNIVEAVGGANPVLRFTELSSLAGDIHTLTGRITALSLVLGPDAASALYQERADGTVMFQTSPQGGVGLFAHAAPTVQPVGGAATAGGTYTAAEQAMLQAVYNAARAIGLLS